MTGTPQYAALPDDPAPKGLQVHWINTLDGARLRVATAPARSKGRARGTVLISPGRTETLEKYFETMRELAGRGLASFVIDHRGQGLSDRSAGPVRGHIERFPLYRGDFRASVETLALQLPQPWVGLGHSMGGLVMLDVAMSNKLKLAGAVLSAPMTGLKRVRGLQLAMAALLVRLGMARSFIPGGSGWRAPPFKRNKVTHDPERYQRVLDRLEIMPELLTGAPTLGWTSAAGRAMRRASRPSALASVRIPVLIITAGDDAIVNNDTHGRAARMIPGAERVIIERAYHEILQETDAVRAAFWAEFDAFLKRIGV